MTCKELALDDLTAIIAIPLAKYTPSGTSIIAPTIAAETFDDVVDEDAITIGNLSQNGSALIPIVRSTGHVKDDENLSVSGRLHTVSADCEVDDRESDVWPLLLRLERTPAHLLLTSRDGSRFFVQGSEDTYLCTVGRDGAKTAVSLKVPCLMGLQMLV